MKGQDVEYCLQVTLETILTLLYMYVCIILFPMEKAYT